MQLRAQEVVHPLTKQNLLRIDGHL
jgi:hypothetical protein